MTKLFSVFVSTFCIHKSIQRNKLTGLKLFNKSSSINNKVLTLNCKPVMFQRYYCKAEESKTSDCESCETKTPCKSCDEPKVSDSFSGDVLKGKQMKKLLKAIKKDTDKKIYNESVEAKFLEAIKYASKHQDIKAVIHVQEIWGNYCMYLSRLDKAEPIFKAMMQNLLVSGSKQTDAAVVKISLKLATIYAHQSKHQLAVAGYDWSVKSCRINLNSQDEGTVESTNTKVLLGMVIDSYARYLHMLGKNEKALELNLEALKLSQELYGEESSQTAVLYNSIASIYVSLGNTKEALKNAKVANKILDKSNSLDNEERAVILHNYCYILKLSGKIELARKKIEACLKLTSDRTLKEKLDNLLSSM